MQKRRYGYAVLLIITFIWGTTFTVTKTALASVPPLYYLAWRFSLAALGLLLLSSRQLLSMTRVELTGGTVLGVFLALGYIAQTAGMVHSTAAKAGFITGLAVVLVPILGAVFFGRRPHFAVYIFVSVAAVGLAFLSLDLAAGVRLHPGDGLLLICAIAFAFNILLVDRYAPRCRVLMLTLVQVTVTALSCWLASFLLEKPGPLSGSLWAGLLYLAVFATILTMAGQTWGQRLVSPERAALVYTLEPVFAAIFARLFLGERLPPAGILGSALIMAGIIGAEIVPQKGKRREMA